MKRLQTTADRLLSASFLLFLITAAMVEVLPLWLTFLSLMPLGLMCFVSNQLNHLRRRAKMRRRVAR